MQFSNLKKHSLMLHLHHWCHCYRLPAQKHTQGERQCVLHQGGASWMIHHDIIKFVYFNSTMAYIAVIRFIRDYRVRWYIIIIEWQQLQNLKYNSPSSGKITLRPRHSFKSPHHKFACISMVEYRFPFLISQIALWSRSWDRRRTVIHTKWLAINRQLIAPNNGIYI